MIDSYDLGDDFRFGPKGHPKNPNVISMTRPIKHAVCPGCSDGDPKGFHRIQRPSTVDGEIGRD